MSKRSYTKEELHDKIKMLEEDNLELRKKIEDNDYIRLMDTRAHYNDGLAEGRREALDLVTRILETIAWYGIRGHQEPEE